jgi:hypothetical protein
MYASDSVFGPREAPDFYLFCLCLGWGNLI